MQQHAIKEAVADAERQQEAAEQNECHRLQASQLCINCHSEQVVHELSVVEWQSIIPQLCHIHFTFESAQHLHTAAMQCQHVWTT